MEKVEWGEYEIQKLFEKIKVKSLKYKTSELPEKKQGNFILPALTAGIQNQGLNNFVPKDNATILKNVISISANGANTGATFYQKEKFTVLQDAYAIDLKDKEILLNDSHYLFLTSAISKTIFGNYEWTNKAGWEKIKTEDISLPTRNGEIDFDFMENFIEELEKEKIEKLNNYLKITGLKDYNLTNEEEKVLEYFESGKLKWEEFKIKDVLDWQKQKEIDPLKLDELIDKQENLYPFYGQSTVNNGVISYNQLTNNILNNIKGQSTILIHSNNQNTIYLESPFYLKDGHGATSVLQSNNLSKLSAHFFISSIKKVITEKYDYNAKATKIELKNTKIQLPIKNSEPNYKLMETLISAIQKLVIKDVVFYADDKINNE